jgi:hypothetical protein
MNEELGHPGLDLIVPDITKACPMFFPWSAESAHTATRRPATQCTIQRGKERILTTVGSKRVIAFDVPGDGMPGYHARISQLPANSRLLVQFSRQSRTRRTLAVTIQNGSRML